jgi:hypothetical protein
VWSPDNHPQLKAGSSFGNETNDSSPVGNKLEISAAKPAVQGQLLEEAETRSLHFLLFLCSSSSILPSLPLTFSVPSLSPFSPFSAYHFHTLQHNFILVVNV